MSARSFANDRRVRDSDVTYAAVPASREEMSSVKCDVKDTVRRRIPIISWLPYYTWDKLLQDCLAGLTVGLTAIPQGIAYAIVAGLPAQYGLYSGFVGCFVYLFLGGSKDITIGPTAIMALMSQSYTSRLGPDGVVLLCFLSGCVISAFGILQLGFLVDFISMPVTSGFTNAAAITIAASQLKSLIGLTGGGNSFIDSIRAVIENIKDTSLWDTVLGISSIALLVGLKQLRGDRRGSWVYKIIWVLSLARNAVVVILATVLAYIFYINGIEAFKLTGTIAEGLPPFGLPPFSICYNNRTYNFGETVSELGSSLISVPLIAILESIAIAKAFAKGRSLDATQEMLALGASNILGSFFRSMPTTGSFTRTAVNNASGVQTQMGGVVTGALVLLACGLLTSTFEFIPKAALAAVIIVAMYYMLEFETFRVLWRTKKVDIIPLTATIVCCVFLSLEYGMIIGIAVNLVLLLYFTARPGVLVVEEEAVHGVRVLLITPRQSLSFPAAEYLREEVIARCESKAENIPVILDGRHVHRIDATVAKNLKFLQTDLESRKQTLIFWNWIPDVRATLESYDVSLAEHFKTSPTIGDIFIEENQVPDSVTSE
ncbi:sodium-independent sulfate anion transporter-like isoform X4 [Athalia rosae]|uniref:sodium-independent sulfate anion transporter-like isoform X4 n=1 Tax=Athalia rosae TaxID=37344 RepID=UPI002034A452|nr:sodium-independent sulfate anion transporter-like isoform X4 [Athalia rosae]